MARDREDALPTGFELEGYRIERVLGAGGFGITYLAIDLEFDRPVAIKEYLPSGIASRSEGASVRPIAGSLQEDFDYGLRRFREEGQTLTAFRHQNIVPVHRFFQANGTAYLVMGYIEGESLAEILRRHAPLPEAEIHEILDPILDGLDQVHRAGFLHRDVKPANIVIDRNGVPVLIDFGAARFAVGGRTQTVTAIITPGFAAPEQYAARGRHGPASDLYGVGATLYCAVAGAPPPEAPERQLHDTLVPAAEAAVGRYDPSLLQAIDEALALKADDRPQSVEEFRRLVRGPKDPTERPEEKRTSRPRPARIWGGAAAVAVALAGAVVAWAPWTTPDSTPAEPPSATAEPPMPPPGNRPPVAVDDTAQAVAGEPTEIAVLANDRDPDDDALAIVDTDPGTPEVEIGGSGPDAYLVYVPPENTAGEVRLSYTITDGHGGRDTAEVTVTVAPANRPPVATDDAVEAIGGETVTVPVLDNDSDPDGDTLTIIATDPAAPTVEVLGTGADARIAFTPAREAEGEVPIRYTVYDGHGGEDTATLTVTVTPANRPPQAVDDAAQVTAGESVTIDVLANDTDPDGDALRLLQTDPEGPNIRIDDDERLVFSPAKDQKGDIRIAYTVSDGRGGEDTATVTVDVRPPNRAPIVADDTAEVIAGESVEIPVLANDRDPDGDRLEVVRVEPTSGEIRIVAGTRIAFAAPPDASGDSRFTYTVSDGRGGTGRGKITISVRAAGPTPEDVEAALGLTQEERSFIQTALNDLGHDVGPEDGMFGVRTREGIRTWQSISKVAATGYLTRAQATQLIELGRKKAQDTGNADDTPTPGLLAPEDQTASTAEDQQAQVRLDPCDHFDAYNERSREHTGVELFKFVGCSPPDSSTPAWRRALFGGWYGTVSYWADGAMHDLPVMLIVFDVRKGREKAFYVHGDLDDGERANIWKASHVISLDENAFQLWIGQMKNSVAVTIDVAPSEEKAQYTWAEYANGKIRRGPSRTILKSIKFPN